MRASALIGVLVFAACDAQPPGEGEGEGDVAGEGEGDDGAATAAVEGYFALQQPAMRDSFERQSQALAQSASANGTLNAGSHLESSLRSILAPGIDGLTAGAVDVSLAQPQIDQDAVVAVFESHRRGDVAFFTAFYLAWPFNVGADAKAAAANEAETIINGSYAAAEGRIP